MDQSMLVCSICPSQPDFSDTSHLLTHVSSKGHLAHLHKLQVKSHQEIAAGVQLANYNQWYQRHGLARLLSERMQQKERRRAKTSTVLTRKRARSVKNEATAEAAHFSASPLRKSTRSRLPTPQLRTSKRETLGHGDEDDNGNASDQDYLPGSQDNQSKHQLFYTPIKNYPAPPSSPQPLDYSPDVDPALDSALTLKIAKLKGKVWPGMALFDAATPDEQRTRNQKKDGSVLRRMERLSRLVDPQEAVYSPNLSLQKQRHIDDLDELSSLVEGEEPASKPKARLRKKPLARVSANVPRLGKRKAKGASTRNQRHAEVATGLPGLPGIAQLASSSTQTSYGFQGDYSPTTDENMEFRLAIGNMSLHKRTGNFAIFNDQESPTRSLNRYSAFAPMQSLNNSYGPPPMQPRLSFNNALWLQPQHQNPIYFGNYPPAQRSVQPAYQPLHEVGLGREIAAPMTERASSHAYQMANPLIWKSPQATLNSHSSDASFGSFSGCFASTSALPDPFSYTRNPLLEALAHLNPDADAGHAESSASSGQTTETGCESADRDTETLSDQHEANLQPGSEECPPNAAVDV